MGFPQILEITSQRRVKLTDKQSRSQIILPFNVSSRLRQSKGQSLIKKSKVPNNNQTKPRPTTEATQVLFNYD